jgi:pimeloyl-ACP methyl ester carboxylesterase
VTAFAGETKEAAQLPHRKTQAKPLARNLAAAPPTVPGRWLLTAASLAILGAAACAWLTLCLLYWQGSWQLLYHPAFAITRTPASVGLDFDPVAFATTESGVPQLKGWWIPAASDSRYGRYTVLYLHGQDGNLSSAVDDLAALHGIGLNILAFDYRGYGQSQFAHPSEARWREDAEWALNYLTATRHINAASIILDGRDLGANLAFEIAAEHSELAGAVLESPLGSPVEAIFSDPRAHLVPARLLVRDRFDAAAPATALRIPSLWLAPEPTPKGSAGKIKDPAGYDSVASAKILVWIADGFDLQKQRANAWLRWLDELPAK